MPNDNTSPNTNNSLNQSAGADGTTLQSNASTPNSYPTIETPPVDTSQNMQTVQSAPMSPMEMSGNSDLPPVNPLPGDLSSVSGDEVVTTSGKSGGGVKKMLLVLVILLILGVVGFLVYKFVFSRSGGGEGSGTNLKPVTLTWWGLWEDSSIVEPVIASYQAQNPNVTVNYVKQSKEDYRERLTNALAKGEGPDIFRYHSTWIPMFKSNLDKMPSSVYSQQDFASTFYPVMAKDLLSDNSYLGVPLEYDGLALYINEDIFTQAGKTAPETWDELRDTAQELTIKDNSGIITQAGAGLGLTANVDHWQDLGILQATVKIILDF